MIVFREGVFIILAYLTLALPKKKKKKRSSLGARYG